MDSALASPMVATEAVAFTRIRGLSLFAENFKPEHHVVDVHAFVTRANKALSRRGNSAVGRLAQRGLPPVGRKTQLASPDRVRVVELQYALEVGKD